MAAVYTQLLDNGTVTAGGDYASYVTLAGQVAIAVDLEAEVSGALSGAIFEFGLLQGPTVASPFVPLISMHLSEVPQIGPKSLQWRGRLLCPYGYAFGYTINTLTGQLNFALTGYVLRAP